MRIAILDYKVQPSNPAGGCHWRMLRDLSREHQFTVFSVDFDNPDPDRIQWVRIPAPRRPLALLFLTYHILAPFYFLRFCRKHRMRFDLVQMVESNFSFGDISYAHFCHRYYLRHFWAVSKPGGLRNFARWLDHWSHGFAERLVYRRVRQLVVPSAGLKREIEREYPFTAGRIRVIHNPIESERLASPKDFDRTAWRHRLGIGPDDRALVFVALGHFERKGLPALLEAMARLKDRSLKLIVVGGTNDVLSLYKNRTRRLGLNSGVSFAGAQNDVRPYLWAADAFVLPSVYETFSLVAYEAAAAGLPLLVAPTNGIDDLLRDGENGIRIGTQPEEIEAGLRTFLSLPVERLERMGACARETARHYSIDSFIELWRELYETWRPEQAASSQPLGAKVAG